MMTLNSLIEKNHQLSLMKLITLIKKRQRVRLGEISSSLCGIMIGIPEGSILDPYIFAVFMSTYIHHAPRKQMLLNMQMV